MTEALMEMSVQGNLAGEYCTVVEGLSSGVLPWHLVSTQ